MRVGCADDDDDAALFAKIKSGKYDVGDPVWNRISSDAKSLVSRMLCVDAAQRLKSEECLQDQWLRSYEAAFENMHGGASAGGSSLPWRAAGVLQVRSERQTVSVTRLLSARSVRRQGLPQGEGDASGWLLHGRGSQVHTNGGSNGSGNVEPGSSSAEDVAYVARDGTGDAQGSNDAGQWLPLERVSGAETFSFP